MLLSAAILIMQPAQSACSPNSMPCSTSHVSYSAVRIALLIQQGAT